MSDENCHVGKYDRRFLISRESGVKDIEINRQRCLRVPAVHVVS